MKLLETERLVIRNFRVDDWEALHESILQYVASGLAAYEPNQWPTTPEGIKGATEWFASGDEYFAVCLKEEKDRYIGFVCLNKQEKEGEFNIGYVFNFNYHGKGYATEACQALLNHAFNQSQAIRIVTGTPTANTASVRLLERLGFRTTETPGAYELPRQAWKAASRDK